MVEIDSNQKHTLVAMKNVSVVIPNLPGCASQDMGQDVLFAQAHGQRARGEAVC